MEKIERKKDLSNVIAILKSEWEEKLSIIIGEKDINIELEVVEALKYNAWASRKANDPHPNSYIISIYDGVFHENWNFYHGHFIKENADLIRMAAFEDEEFNFDDNFTIMLANLYFRASMNFVFFHEVGHIINGHLNYLKSIRENQNSLKMNKKKSALIKDKGITAYEHQAIEIDADLFSCNTLIEQIIAEYRVKKELATPTPYGIANNEKRLLLMLFSAMINESSLRLIGENRGDWDLEEDCYIPPRMRLKVFLDEFIKKMNTYVKNDEYPQELFQEHVDAFEDIINKYLVDKHGFVKSAFSTENSRDELEKPVIEHVEFLFKEIYPSLKEKINKLN